MKFSDIHPVLREALGMHQAFRKCGFPSEEIFVSFNPTLPPSMLVILKTQGKEFSVNVGIINMSQSKWEKAWTEVCTAVVDNRVNEEDLGVIWESCMAFRDKVGFVVALEVKGINIPGPDCASNPDSNPDAPTNVKEWN